MERSNGHNGTIKICAEWRTQRDVTDVHLPFLKLVIMYTHPLTYMFHILEEVYDILRNRRYILARIENPISNVQTIFGDCNLPRSRL